MASRAVGRRSGTSASRVRNRRGGPDDGRPTPGRRVRRGAKDPLAGGAEVTRAVGADSDALLLLQSEHRTLTALLDRAAADGRALVRFRREIDAHIRVEGLFHGALRQERGTASVLRGAKADQDHLVRLAGAAGAPRRGTPGFDRHLDELRSALLDHVRAEEGPIFASALAKIDRPRLVALAEEMERVRQAAPRRPSRLRTTTGTASGATPGSRR